MPGPFLCQDCHDFLSLWVPCAEQGVAKTNFGKGREKDVWLGFPPYPPTDSTSSGFWNWM